MVSPQKIKYNDTEKTIHQILTPMDVILDVSFDSDNGTMSSYLNRSAVASESHDGRYKNTYKYKYDELFSPRFTIVKKDFSDFTQDEVRKVLKYLTSTDKPALLEVYYEDNDVVSWACIGGWTSIETYKIANSRTVGIVAQFEAITPYAMSRLYEKVTNNTIQIDIETDDNQPVYPCITIQQKGTSGDVKITNQHYDAFGSPSTPITTTVKNNGQTEKIVLDGANRVISSTNARRIFGDDFVDWIWLPLYDGKNVITIDGNCDVTFEYREVRKVGEY